jgi:hypothetical protein
MQLYTSEFGVLTDKAVYTRAKCSMYLNVSTNLDRCKTAGVVRQVW